MLLPLCVAVICPSGCGLLQQIVALGGDFDVTPAGLVSVPRSSQRGVPRSAWFEFQDAAGLVCVIYGRCLSSSHRSDRISGGHPHKVTS